MCVSVCVLMSGKDIISSSNRNIAVEELANFQFSLKYWKTPGSENMKIHRSFKSRDNRSLYIYIYIYIYIYRERERERHISVCACAPACVCNL